MPSQRSPHYGGHRKTLRLADQLMTPVSSSQHRRAGHPPPQLSSRARAILAAVVQSYIERGEPISSLWLTRHSRFGVSSATLRNKMAELEELGYVHQPHASAGRIPTDRGYRCYVDLLLEARRPARSSRNVEARLRRASAVGNLLHNVPHELSRASHHLSFAMAPSGEGSAFKQINFVPLDRQRVLVVVVAASGHVSHKVISVSEALRPVDLTQAANYLNQEFAGLPLYEVRRAIVEQLESERTLCNVLRARALQLARNTFENLSETSLFVQGTSLLLDNATDDDDSSSMSSLSTLFEMIEEKDRLVRLLNGYIDDPGMIIIIGTEHRTENLQNLSLIASTYFDGNQIGCVGIIGPRRMRYDRSIAAVEGVSRTVSRLLGTGGTWAN